MTTYVFRRLIQALIVVLIVTLLVFLAVRLLPGDPVLMFLSGDQMAALSPEQVEDVRHKFGLDKPLLLQYADYMKGLIHGDLGDSLFYRRPVTALLAERLPRTAYLGGLAFILSTLFGVAAGTISALNRGKWPDVVTTIAANIGITIPVFWLGILMMYFFSYYLGWLPMMGYTSPFVDLGKSLKQAIMPVICLMVFAVSGDARQSRSSVLEVVRQDYIRTAWAKGLSKPVIVIKHMMKNALIPIVTMKGMAMGMILGGSVFEETVFNIPGIGRLMVEGVQSKDYAVVQGTVLICVVMVVLSNLLADLSYGWLDPRIRYR